MKKNVPKTAASAVEAVTAATNAAQWLQPSAAIRIGSGARHASTSATLVPDTADTNMIAEAAPNAELWEYSSGQAPMDYDDVYTLLEGRGLLDLSSTTRGEEFLR